NAKAFHLCLKTPRLAVLLQQHLHPEGTNGVLTGGYAALARCIVHELRKRNSNSRASAGMEFRKRNSGTECNSRKRELGHPRKRGRLGWQQGEVHRVWDCVGSGIPSYHLCNACDGSSA
ncbi:hypothetical protein, partial [Streptomyces sp. NBC_01314]|uniref:hypothetical protein n=1 Tax=Streptomyces sp. NBC_01314 TaxID=2903821 RepID=UPI00352FB59E